MQYQRHLLEQQLNNLDCDKWQRKESIMYHSLHQTLQVLKIAASCLYQWPPIRFWLTLSLPRGVIVSHSNTY